MAKRIIAGLIAGSGVIVILTILPKFCFNILIALVAIAATYEFIGAINHMNYKPIKSVAYISSIVLLFIGLIPNTQVYKWSIAYLGAMVIITLIYAFFVRKENNSLIDVCFTFFNILYVVVLLTFLLMTFYVERNGIDLGRYLVWYILLGAWGPDIFAYFIGTFFGKHKLCPTISPKKSVEGAIAGIIGGIALLVLYTMILNNKLGLGINYISIALVGLIVAIFSELGDLVASSIKRTAGIKDFGSFLPGHGGMLDRIDSVLFVAPTIYYFLVFFNVLG
ncbi:MAG: phosphatidate cytidylyltransferase [Clostridia bacterium]|nr:phosphatidate cytidylyltransferase [Clostridia bacterium]